MIVLKFKRNDQNTHAWRETMFKAQSYVLNNSVSFVNVEKSPC